MANSLFLLVIATHNKSDISAILRNFSSNVLPNFLLSPPEKKEGIVSFGQLTPLVSLLVHESVLVLVLVLVLAAG